MDGVFQGQAQGFGKMTTTAVLDKDEICYGQCYNNIGVAIILVAC